MLSKKNSVPKKKKIGAKFFSTNGHAYWISGKMLNGKKVRHFVVQPKLCILGFGICICICIWDLYLAKWACQFDFWRNFEWENGKTHYFTTKTEHFRFFVFVFGICIWPNGHAH